MAPSELTTAILEEACKNFQFPLNEARANAEARFRKKKY
jgi:hypothetical protein